jgi:hypothetical protein
MTYIDGPGYWRIIRGEDGIDAESIDVEEYERLVAEGSRDVTRVDEDGYGYQNSGGALLLPGGQTIPNGVFTALWNCK